MVEKEKWHKLLKGDSKIVCCKEDQTMNKSLTNEMSYKNHAPIKNIKNSGWSKRAPKYQPPGNF